MKKIVNNSARAIAKPHHVLIVADATRFTHKWDA